MGVGVRAALANPEPLDVGTRNMKYKMPRSAAIFL